MASGTHVETEIKLAVASADQARALLAAHGYTVSIPRVFEANDVYDTEDLALRGRGELIRLRTHAPQPGAILTFKGPAADSKHKQREELETGVGDAVVLDGILKRLGLAPKFRYEKYRTEFCRSQGEGVVTVDETPIGVYLELEGAPAWIDQTAEELGFSQNDYILASYGALYFEHCRAENISPGNCVFSHSQK